MTHSVGEKAPNPFGLFDVHGNVLEWCEDIYAADAYRTLESSGVDPVNLTSSDGPKAHRVLRGGSYEGKPDYLRSGDRYHEQPEFRWRGFGLRPTRRLD